jgi:DNA-binding transcriptional MerR regulator
MITIGGENLYTATEVAKLFGVTNETIGLYAKKAGIVARRISRVKYYTEEEIKGLLQISPKRSKDVQ